MELSSPEEPDLVVVGKLDMKPVLTLGLPPNLEPHVVLEVMTDVELSPSTTCQS